MNKISPYFLLLAFIVGVAAAYLYIQYWYQPRNTVTVQSRMGNNLMILKLPKTPDTTVFGPEYWKAYDAVSNSIPCSGCRHEAVSFISFFHDLVNKKLEKPLYNADNYNNWLDTLQKLPKA